MSPMRSLGGDWESAVDVDINAWFGLKHMLCGRGGQRGD